MQRRSGGEVETRLRQCSLYDPALDLAVRDAEGRAAGYALFWLDPVTEVGLLEPMRVEDEYQRRGLARALLTEGLERLAQRGARRLKVGYATEIARALYVGAGFRRDRDEHDVPLAETGPRSTGCYSRVARVDEQVDAERLERHRSRAGGSRASPSRAATRRSPRRRC